MLVLRSAQGSFGLSDKHSMFKIHAFQSRHWQKRFCNPRACVSFLHRIKIVFCFVTYKFQVNVKSVCCVEKDKEFLSFDTLFVLCVWIMFAAAAASKYSQSCKFSCKFNVWLLCQWNLRDQVPIYYLATVFLFSFFLFFTNLSVICHIPECIVATHSVNV